MLVGTARELQIGALRIVRHHKTAISNMVATPISRRNLEVLAKPSVVEPLLDIGRGTADANERVAPRVGDLPLRSPATVSAATCVASSNERVDHLRVLRALAPWVGQAPELDGSGYPHEQARELEFMNKRLMRPN